MASTLPVLLGVWLVAVITPGPDFLVIVRHATAGSRRHGFAAAIGTNCGISPGPPAACSACRS